ncbi:MAG: transglutaminase-like cysteine peptidase [Alphaproteobacteria bacterium]|nr:transglutaminase-like cysteine peptidase [Alphaproteobacteria bacterium]
MKDMLSETDLRRALDLQKKTRQPLGQVLLEEAVISHRQLFSVLARQFTLRAITAASLCLFSLTGIGIKKARAGGIDDIPARIAFNISAQAYTDVASYPALFGSQEKRSRNLAAFTKWSSMFERFDQELNAKSSARIVREFQENIEDFKTLPLRDMASRVNDVMNAKRYIVDSKNWGKSDYWATPIEFMRRGGDCEDFAIAKYAALRVLGVPEERLRIAIVHDTQKNIPHALLIVYTDQGAYYLDNQTERIVSANTPGRYRPIFSINRTAWWLHSAPESSTIVASAQ